MDVKRLLLENKKRIDGAIEKYIPRVLDANKMRKFLGQPRYVYEAKTAEKAVNTLIWDLLDRGGKRWRPSLLIWTAEALGFKGDALDFSVIPEVVHNGTLVIDDLEDNALLRRGKPCLHVKYGVDLAVNAGDTMYFLPLQVLAKKKLGPKLKTRMYEIAIQEMVNLSYGQGFDIYWHKGLAKKVTEAQYLQMCAYKTGTLARMAARLGAALANASLKKEKAVAEFAEALGVAFQIQDDVLNIISKKQEYGKTVGEDIAEGKRTLMVIHALHRLPESERRELLGILNEHTKDESKIQRAIALLEKSGSIEYAKEKAQHLVQKAWQKVEPLLSEGRAKQALNALAWYVIERKL